MKTRGMLMWWSMGLLKKYSLKEWVSLEHRVVHVVLFFSNF